MAKIPEKSPGAPSANRAEIVHASFRSRVAAGDFPTPVGSLSLAEAGLTGVELVDLFETQLMSRHLDLVSRRLSRRGESFYTIGSAGHEGNAVFGKLFRTTDMAFLHYRSAALLIQRSKQVPGETPLYDMLLSFAASAEDPISGGRHKVLGSKTLLVPPQTSTIASHLPKAMGAAHAIGLARHLDLAGAVMPHDSVILCNFGDASANHSTALGALNAAAWAAYQNSPMPIVFICEDNGIGISTPTPDGWIRARFSGIAGLEYRYCDGLDLLETHQVTKSAVAYARQQRKPVFLHCRTLRLLGHAGSDAEISYRAQAEIERIEAQDPLLHSARLVIGNGLLDADQVLQMDSDLQARVDRIAEQAIRRPRLRSPAEIMAPIIPRANTSVGPNEIRQKSDPNRTLSAAEQRAREQPQPMARLIGLALADLMAEYQNTVICGEDVGRKGGVYGVTQGLRKAFGPARVIDTLLDEQSILGLALGLAHNGFVAIPEIQFLAYLHNAEDQLRGEAATLPFFSNGQYTNPMVIRIAGLAYQKGFGGHFHNDNSVAVLRDIPGLILACPSNGRDAVHMLRTCMAEAQEQGRVAVFLEPIALYQARDLYQEGDGLWQALYPQPGAGDPIQLGQVGVSGDGRDLCILTYANGYHLSLQAARRLERQGVAVRVVDLRWLAPLDTDEILRAVEHCRQILIVDECRRTGSVSEALITLLVEHQIRAPLARLTAEDCFIPLGPAAHQVLPGVESIERAALKLLGTPALRLAQAPGEAS